MDTCMHTTTVTYMIMYAHTHTHTHTRMHRHTHIRPHTPFPLPHSQRAQSADGPESGRFGLGTPNQEGTQLVPGGQASTPLHLWGREESLEVLLSKSVAIYREDIQNTVWLINALAVKCHRRVGVQMFDAPERCVAQVSLLQEGCHAFLLACTL